MAGMAQSPHDLSIGHVCGYRYSEYSAFLHTDKPGTAIHWKMCGLATVKLRWLYVIVCPEWNINNLVTISVYKTEDHRDRAVRVFNPAIEHGANYITRCLRFRQLVVAQMGRKLCVSRGGHCQT
jgi:hypothetical protein